MKILCLIPARGGSKRLPGKNKKILGGKPLIKWTIQSAKKISDFCDILVSTDDPKIAQIAKSEEVLVPWLRPKKLAFDNAKSIDVALHALKWYEKTRGNIDGILLLQPTSPFRKTKTIIKAIKIFKKKPGYAVISVKKNNKNLKNLILKKRFNRANKKETQKKAFKLTGSIYCTPKNTLKKNKSFLGKKWHPLIIQTKKENLDIDTKTDFKTAQRFLKK